MAVAYYVPEGGADDAASSTSSGSNGSNASGSATSSTSQSPNTTTSATQTPMQSPFVPDPHIVMAMYETLRLFNNTPTFQYPTPVFQYPVPSSPCCSMHSPAHHANGAAGEVFFPHNRSTPRTPRTSVSFAAGDDATSSFCHHNSSAANTSSTSSGQQQQQQQPVHPPQSAPPHMPHSHSQPQFQPMAYPCCQYTPPPTPLTAHNGTFTTSVGTCTSSPCMAAAAYAASTQTAKGGARLHRSHSDTQRRSRRTSTAKDDEHECHSEHETSWDEFDDRFDNFTAGRERLQEFNGRIPPRKKKKDVPKPKPEKKFRILIWPTVVTVIVVAMGCGLLVAR